MDWSDCTRICTKINRRTNHQLQAIHDRAHQSLCSTQSMCIIHSTVKRNEQTFCNWQRNKDVNGNVKCRKAIILRMRNERMEIVRLKMKPNVTKEMTQRIEFNWTKPIKMDYCFVQWKRLLRFSLVRQKQKQNFLFFVYIISLLGHRASNREEEEKKKTKIITENYDRITKWETRMNA